MSTAIEGAFIIVMALLALLGAGICIGQYFRRKQRLELLPPPDESVMRRQRDLEREMAEWLSIEERERT